MRNHRRMPFRVFVLLVSVVAMSSTSWARKLNDNDIGQEVKISLNYGRNPIKISKFIPEDENEIGFWNEVLFHPELPFDNNFAPLQISINGKVDPSLAYNFIAANPDSEPNVAFLNVDMPITSLAGPNTVSAELTIDLMDTNNDGIASLVHEQAFPGFQRAFVFDEDGGPVFNPSWDLGLTDITKPGVHTFTMEPQPGVIDATADTLGFSVKFQLSPGDTVQLKGSIFIDDGSGTPAAEIPLLPSEGGGCQIINTINSPDTIIGDRERIGSCTHLNVSEGGQVGNLVRAGFSGGFEAFDSVVNITGGTVGSLEAAGGSVVNFSGGTVDGGISVLAGGEVNLSDGSLSRVTAFQEGVVNISGGTHGSLSTASIIVPGQEDVRGGELNVSGGSFVSRMLVNEGGVANISGGDVIGRPGTAVKNGGEMNLFGSRFLVNGETQDLKPGERMTITERDIRLSGELSDGTTFDFDLCAVFCPASGLYEPDATITVTLDAPVTEVVGDFNANGILDAADIDLLVAGSDFDLTNDGVVNQDDRKVWVENLANTFFGDANLDGEFNTTDLVVVFQADQYEDENELNSGWAEGDWNGDREFGTSDMIVAFQGSGFEKGPRIVAVPEPTLISNMFIVLGALILGRFGRIA